MGRHKKKDNEKKKNISISINNYIFDKIDKHLKENNINRSKFVEDIWIEYIKRNTKNGN